jgi:hypothetical protein
MLRHKMPSHCVIKMSICMHKKSHNFPRPDCLPHCLGV